MRFPRVLGHNIFIDTFTIYPYFVRFVFLSSLVPNIIYIVHSLTINLLPRNMGFPPKEVLLNACVFYIRHIMVSYPWCLAALSTSLGTQRKHQMTITSFPTEHKQRVHSAQAGRRQSTPTSSFPLVGDMHTGWPKALLLCMCSWAMEKSRWLI